MMKVVGMGKHTGKGENMFAWKEKITGNFQGKKREISVDEWAIKPQSVDPGGPGRGALA